MRLILLGSGAFGLPTFQALRAQHEIVHVVSQPDKPAGRKRKLTPTPVAEWALQEDLPLLRTDNANTPGIVQDLTNLKADAAVVIAFGQKLSPELIGALGKLAINLHASLLPKYRGAAPINWAMIDGEAETGVSVIGLAQRMDAGAVYATSATPIDPLETIAELYDRLALLGPDAVVQVLKQLEAGALQPLDQDDTQATRAPKLSKSDGVVDFTGSATQARQRIHGLTPWPGVKVIRVNAQGEQEGELLLRRVKDHPDEAHQVSPGSVLPTGHIALGSGALELLEVQPPGKGVMPIAAYLQGNPMPGGTVLRSPTLD